MRWAAKALFDPGVCVTKKRRSSQLRVLNHLRDHCRSEFASVQAATSVRGCVLRQHGADTAPNLRGGLGMPKPLEHHGGRQKSTCRVGNALCVRAASTVNASLTVVAKEGGRTTYFQQYQVHSRAPARKARGEYESGRGLRKG
jgi:hypothetical protein